MWVYLKMHTQNHCHGDRGCRWPNTTNRQAPKINKFGQMDFGVVLREVKYTAFPTLSGFGHFLGRFSRIYIPVLWGLKLLSIVLWYVFVLSCGGIFHDAVCLRPATASLCQGICSHY